ncbi:hypothetical protein F442_01027 [Phytophthora nicotianae P10297]|uniref:Uncharacterized protein n=1 Tax=Phytophthora nicotianae P10297 TaxID=1317064 RepID=W3A4Q9_PHYNI|nr:hypothetical protein F442_01027 [Phytophthora nicotianae P10297]
MPIPPLETNIYSLASGPIKTTPLQSMQSSFCRTNMTKPWDADGEKPGSPTSMDILVRWLGTPDNYKKWKSKERQPLLEEICSDIKKHVATKRSDKAVRCKILKLEKQFKDATTWLSGKGQLVAYTDGKASEDVVQGVLQRCPLYSELSTVFQSMNADTEAETKHGDETKSVMDNGTTEEEQKCAKLSVTQGDQKRSQDAVDDNQISKKQRKHKAPEPQPALVQDNLPRVERSAGEVRSIGGERSLALAEFKRESESRWNEYCGVSRSPCLRETEEKLAQQILQREIEHVDAMAKLQFEAEQKRQELQTTCAMVLSRHKLRIAGVSEEDVDSMIPK